MSGRLPKAECVMDHTDPTRPLLRCLRCGATHPTQLPMSVTTFCKAVKAFEALHRTCEAAKPAEGGAA